MSNRDDRLRRAAVVYQRRRRELRWSPDQPASLPVSTLRQTYDMVRTQLSALGPGNTLVEADLMRSLAASRGSVRAALQRLAAEGLVSRKTKVGTRVERFVHLPFSYLLPDEDKVDLDVSMKITTSVVTAPHFLQNMFGLEASLSVAMIDGVMSHGTEPIGVSVGYVPLTPEEAKLAERWQRSTLGTIDFIEQQLGVQLGFSRASLGALACDAETSQRLAVAEGAHMLWLEQVFVDEAGDDRGLLHAHYRADRVGFSGFMQRRPDVSRAPWAAA
jgi:GntR family transcriptional regulator